MDYSVAVSGLTAAYAGMDTIGNNIANASTEGYHCQRVELAPSANGATEKTAGSGVDVAGVTRLINTLLEREILSQKSSQASVGQELSTLSTVEASFGEFSEDSGLNAAIDDFFSALQSLAANPADSTCRNEVLSTAETMTDQLRQLSSMLTSMKTQVTLQVQQSVESINLLTEQIAELNTKIQKTQTTGTSANNLLDQRDQLIGQLAKLAGVETVQRDFGVVDIAVAGFTVVIGSAAMNISVGQRSDQSLGIAGGASEDYGLSVEGGQLGGLMTLRNELLPDIEGQLNALAQEIINQVNQRHAQGLGTAGSFTELSGLAMTEDSLADAGVTDGSVYVRVTNTVTGDVSRHEVDVTTSGATPDTLASIATKLNAITGISASVVSSQLYISSDLGYAFDFIPAVLSEPTETDFAATAPPSVSVSGLYQGDDNQTLTFTVVGTGSVGNGSLRVNVTNSDGDAVATFNVGSGYAAGDAIGLSNGLTISLGIGDLVADDTFKVEVFANTDTAGLLAAAGMNTFFTGAGAGDIRVSIEVSDEPNRIATAMGSDLTDNTAALNLARVQKEEFDSLNGMTLSEYYQRTVADLGQKVSLAKAKESNAGAILQSLEDQQSQVSGIDVNNEAAQLLVFEQMYQASAKYLSSLQQVMEALMNAV
jgi:flagellar hook-associated protein 1